MEKRKTGLIVSCLCLLLAAQSAFGAGSIGGPVIVGSGSGNVIRTVLGCTERFVCEGVGDDITWRVFGSRTTLENITDKRIVTLAFNETNHTVKSQLIISNITTEDQTIFYCNIRDGIQTRTYTAELRVNNTIVYIEPINTIDISNRTYGEVISIGCRVLTCLVIVEVTIVRGGQAIKQATNISDTSRQLMNIDLEVNDEIVNEYACVVNLLDGKFGNSTIIMEKFNITGTPRPTTAPITVTGGGPSSPPSGSMETTSKNMAVSTLLSASLLMQFLVLGLTVVSVLMVTTSML